MSDRIRLEIEAFALWLRNYGARECRQTEIKSFEEDKNGCEYFRKQSREILEHLDPADVPPACQYCGDTGIAPWIMGDFLRACGLCPKGEIMWRGGYVATPAFPRKSTPTPEKSV